MPPHSLTMTMIGACAALGRLVRLQRRLEPRSLRRRRARDDQHVRRDRGGGARLDVRRVDGEGQALAARRASPARSRVLSRSRRRPAYAGPMGAIVLGLIAGVVCFFFCSAVKNALGYDDALDVFGVHCVGGIVGAILHRHPGQSRARRHRHHGLRRPARSPTTTSSTQLIAQCKAVGMTLLWSGIGTLIILKVIDVIIGLRADARQRARRPRPHRSRRARLQHVTHSLSRAGEGRRRTLRTRLGWRPGTAPSVERPRLTPRPLTFLPALCARRLRRERRACQPSFRSTAARFSAHRMASAALALPQHASAQGAVLTRPIPSSGEALPLVGLGKLDHLQCRQRSAGARFLRRRDARVLRGRRAHDRFLADVRLLAAGDRRRAEEVRRRERVLRRQGVDLVRPRAGRRRSKPRANSGACRSSICCRCIICSPGKSTCARCSP